MHRTVLHRTCTDPTASPPACVQTNVPGALPGGGAGAPAGEPLPKKKRNLAELMGECIVMLWKCFEAVKCIKGTFNSCCWHSTASCRPIPVFLRGCYLPCR